MATHLLVYDIPKKSGLANPSKRLRRLGVRINLSCWVIREENIPWNLLNELREGGASWHTVAFADDEAQTLLTMALEALQRDADAAAKRAEESIARADSLLDQGDPAASRRRADAAIKRPRKLPDALRQAAGPCGANVPSLDIVTKVRGLQTAAHERARQYAAMARATAELG